jgi:hypothetical protein
MSDIKSPFDFNTPNGAMLEVLTIVDPSTKRTKSGKLIVDSPLSDGSVELPEYAVKVYNVIMGAQLMMELTPDLPERDAEISEYINTGMRWFMKHFPIEYAKLRNMNLSDSEDIKDIRKTAEDLKRLLTTED